MALRKVGVVWKLRGREGFGKETLEKTGQSLDCVHSGLWAYRPIIMLLDHAVLLLSKTAAMYILAVLPKIICRLTGTLSFLKNA